MVTNSLSYRFVIIESVMGEMLPKTRAYCSRSTLVRDLLPALLAVIQPVLRPVGTMTILASLFIAKENAPFDRLTSFKTDGRTDDRRTGGLQTDILIVIYMKGGESYLGTV